MKEKDIITTKPGVSFITTQVTENFTFDSDISEDQKTKLLERHKFAYEKINECSRLTEDQKSKLKEGYAKAIRHSTLTTPGVNAKAEINGSRVWINFGVLFPEGDREIAQTLIHEMMHISGYTHPARTAQDEPYDNGVYYGTPPLQSEMCIAGVQSDQELRSLDVDDFANCVPSENGEYTIMTQNSKNG